jgi:hypothetical protein
MQTIKIEYQNIYKSKFHNFMEAAMAGGSPIRNIAARDEPRNYKQASCHYSIHQSP